MQNFIITFVLILVSWAITIPVPSIGDAMTILGATTNSGMGFLFPVIFYLKTEENTGGGPWRSDRLIAKLVFVTVCIFSIIELYCFVYKYTN